MSRFIDKLNRISRAAPQPMGFRTSQPTSTKPKIQLVASLAQGSVEQLSEYVIGADAGLLRISKPGSGVKTLQNIAQAVSDIPWGVGLQYSLQGEREQILKADCDFVVFSAASTPLAILQNDREVGKILEVEPSISEGLLRAANELPLNAVLLTTEQSENYSLTWQHLMLFQRFSDLLTKPLLVSAPPNVTADELQALWEAGVGGVVIEVKVGQPQDRFKELRQIIDNLTFPSPRQREKVEPLLTRTGQDSGAVETDEEWDDKD